MSTNSGCHNGPGQVSNMTQVQVSKYPEDSGEADIPKDIITRPFNNAG